MKHRNRVFFYFGKVAFVDDNLIKSVLLHCFSWMMLYQWCRASISCGSSPYNKPLLHRSHWSSLVNWNIHFMASDTFLSTCFLGSYSKIFCILNNLVQCWWRYGNKNYYQFNSAFIDWVPMACWCWFIVLRIKRWIWNSPCPQSKCVTGWESPLDVNVYRVTSNTYGIK